MNDRLDCDQVFDVLTRGPFPTGTTVDDPVERHLDCCHECRQLAEALRPAVALFHESIAPEDARDLPGYRGARETSTVGLAQLVAEAIAAEAPRAARPATQPAPRGLWREALREQAWPLLAAVALGSLFALTLWGHSAPFRKADHQFAGAPVTARSEGLLHLASLSLPGHCFTLPASDAARLHCCTECHAAKSVEPRLAPPALAIVAANCRTCHP
jgi:hypothetical protein